MHLQLSTVSLLLSATSTVSASLLGSLTQGVSGALLGALGGSDGQSGSDGPVPLRRSITELAAEAGPQWDLYLQALRALQDRDAKDPESYFQIAGIHGRPFVEYNNAGSRNTNGWWGGYSTHGENIFIIWHRPFLSLFEQALVKEAKIVADSYPEDLRSIYQQAANDLRAPYWDWALEPRLPSVVLPETIQVNAPSKTGTVSKSIDNPLFTYRFPKEANQGKYGPFNTLDRMYRCQNPNAANQNLYSRNYKTWVYDTFTMANSFSEFATTASQGGSLEAVHNAVHWDAGCGGQFMNSEYSAFEPLFMLHHSNVDRLWAYWQAMHPEASTFNGGYYGLGRFTTFAGSLVNLDSPLEPFKQPNGQWHTSRSVNNIKTFGYSYKGLEYWTKSESEMQQSAVQMINSLYGPEQVQKPSPTSTTAAPKSTKTSTKQSSQPAATSASTQSQSAGSSTKASMPSSQSQSAGSSTKASVPSSQSTQTAGNSTVSSQSTAEVSQSTVLPSSGSAVITSAISSGASAAVPTASAGVGSHPETNTTETCDQKRFFAGITVDVSYLPIRPCSIEVSLDIWGAGGMAIMMMPEKGTVYDSISLTDAITSAGMDQFSGDELLQQILSRIHVVLRTANGGTIDVSQISGLKVDINEVDIIAPKSEFELPQTIKTTTHVALDKPVSGCAAH
ncbi:hypothetical protein NLG97_g453 [Lecanicillium saksenae]|uniref:Uncharacterized protein n=1 Tax=Lecanicillium saksenae TaxID=468837 RepID=A0ACC1R8A6_9HYPO|nr:hypothetical protein NLG97_g453 [Lecanicillium saksenae]